MPKKNYLNFIKIKNFFDEVFNKKGFDYYKANKVLADLISISQKNEELKNDETIKTLKKYPESYFKVIFLPSEKDIKEILSNENVDNSVKLKLQKLLQSGIVRGIAYITEGIIETENKKTLGYIIAINSGIIPDLDEYESLSEKERISYLKTLGCILSGLLHHEVLGHVRLKRLEYTFFEDPAMDNLMKYLVINTRMERYLPETAECLRKIGVVFYDTWYKFPNAVDYILKMRALLDPDKFKKVNGKIKPIDKEEFKKEVSKIISKIEKNYKLAFLDEEDIPESLKNLKENYAKYIDNGTFINEFIKTLSQIAKNAKETKNPVNFVYFDKIFLENFDELISIFKNHSPEYWEKLRVYLKKPIENYTDIDIDEFDDIYGVKIIDPKDNENKSNQQQGKQKGKGGGSGQGFPNETGTLENGNVRRLDEVFKEIFYDFVEELDEDEAKKAEDVLKEITEKVEKEIIGEIENCQALAYEYQRMRKEYKPGKKIKCLLVAESPPESDELSFFYNPEYYKYEPLFESVMEVIFGEDFVRDYKDNRSQRKKCKYLKKLKNKGFYLIDAVDCPINDLSECERNKIIKKNLNKKIKEIESLVDKDTPIILIKNNIHKIFKDKLINLNFRYVNLCPIPFPSHGNQKRFKKEFKNWLKIFNLP